MGRRLALVASAVLVLLGTLPAVQAQPAGKVSTLGVLKLVVNLRTAMALGLTIPQSLRLRADQVIE